MNICLHIHMEVVLINEIEAMNLKGEIFAAVFREKREGKCYNSLMKKINETITERFMD